MQKIEFKLTDEDRELLKQAAAAKNMPVSAFVRECVQAQLPKQTNKQPSAGIDDQLDDGPAPSKNKTKSVEVYLSEEDYAKIKHDAGRIPMSTYMRNVLINRDASKYVFEVDTDDLRELNETIAEINMHVDAFIGALRFRNDIFPADIENMERLITQTNDAVSALSSEIFKNRENIRKDAKKYLHNRIDRVVKHGGE
jgi:predicted DNA binding CopG/RHH family protein